jgi:poly-gamma-glutamate synthesis protein (capsule biosynthesis protein)
MCLAFIAVTDISNSIYHGTELENHLNWADRDRLLPGFEEAKSKADIIILSYHGGVEYTSKPTQETREFLHWAVDKGVDLVLGHHPHFFQGVEWYNAALIIYSLGNFTFYQKGLEYWTDYGLAASIRIGSDGILGAEFIPIRAHYQAQVIEDVDLKDEILKRLIKLSSSDHVDTPTY